MPRLNTPNTPLAHIPKTFKDTEIIDTSPKVKNKSENDIGDLYTYTMNRLSKDKRYRKLGWQYMMKLNILLLTLMACINCYATELQCSISDDVIDRRHKVGLLLIHLDTIKDMYHEPFSVGKHTITYDVETYHAYLKMLDDCILMPYGQ